MEVIFNETPIQFEADEQHPNMTPELQKNVEGLIITVSKGGVKARATFRSWGTKAIDNAVGTFETGQHRITIEEM